MSGFAAKTRRALTVAAGLALLCTGLSFFFASQIVAIERGRVPWRVALEYTMPRWYVWGLLAPAVFWINKRLGVKTLAARVILHVPLAIAFTLLSIVIRLLIRPLRGAPPPADLMQFFLERFYWDLLIYAVIAGVSISRDLARQARAREIETHALALRTANLERSLTEARLQTLRAQLHPHFLFNALNTISAFTETDPQMARRLMGQLGDLLRASLTHASRPVVTLGEELTFLDDYLAIELARFEGRLAVTVDAEDDLLQTHVPSFVLQPIVENAIRHGIARRMSGGRIDVTVARVNGELRMRVRDDGTGLPDAWQFDRDAGIGLRNVSARLEHIYNRDDLLHITANDEGGVDVDIRVPIDAAAGRAAAPSPIAAAGT